MKCIPGRSKIAREGALRQLLLLQFRGNLLRQDSSSRCAEREDATRHFLHILLTLSKNGRATGEGGAWL